MAGGFSRCKLHPQRCQRCAGTIEIGQYYVWSNIVKRAYHRQDDAGNCLPDWTPNGVIPETPDLPETPSPDPPTMPDTTKTPPDPAQALRDFISSLPVGLSEEQVRKIAVEAASKAVETLPRIDQDAIEAAVNKARVVTLQVTRRDVPDVQITGAHKQMKELIYWTGKGKHVILYGAPGAGKSHATRQCAEALGRECLVESLAPSDHRSQLVGFKGLDGQYHGTRFRTAVEFGHVLVLEEGDNTSSALLVTLNVLLANGHISFPDREVKVHPDFVCIVCMNTAGRGGDVLYPERRPVDVAFMNRFVCIKWEYDTDLETRLALAYNPNAGPWIEWVQALRDWAETNKKKLLVTPRQSVTLAEALADGTLQTRTVVDQVVFGTADPDLRREALAAHPMPGGK